MEIINNSNLPLQFQLALEKNENAVVYFNTLPIQTQNEIIETGNAIENDIKMEKYVNSLFDISKI
ncbi:MAG: hypothetical protein RR322_05235 [Oscillospiraceae bacterium]